MAKLLPDSKPNHKRGDTLKIMIYSEYFLPNIGGGEMYCYDLSRGLKMEGVENVILTTTTSRMENENELEVIRLRKVIRFLGFNISLLKVFRSIRITRPNIIHISGPTILDPFLAIICRISGIKCFLTYHAQFPSKIGRLFHKISMKLTKHFFNSILVQSQRDYEYLNGKNNFCKNVIKTFFSNLDPKKFACSGPIVKKKQILFVGRLDSGHYYKGLDLLISALNKMILLKEVPYGLKIVIVGSGNRLNHFIKMVNPKLEDTFCFIGDVNQKELIKLYCESYYSVLPSHRYGEGFGRVALESIFCGTPVIVSKYAGISDTISSYDCGIVIDPYDFEVFSKTIIQSLENEEQFSTYVRNALKVRESPNFQLTASIRKLIELYMSQ